MKYFVCFLLFVIFSTSIFSQESIKKQKEVAISFYNFSEYGLTYKVGKQDKFWRFRALTGGIFINTLTNNDPSLPDQITSSFTANITTSIGREKRKELAPKVNLVLGFDIIGSYDYGEYTNSQQQKRISHSASAGLGGVIGMRYEISPRFYAGAELLPSIMYNFRNSGSTNSVVFGRTSNQLAIGFGNNSALLSFGIKF